MSFDVAIAGAGPAGSALAIHLRRAGLSVALLDRAEFPRPKACGEGLFPAGVVALRGLGVDPDEVGIPLHGVRFLAGRASVEAPLSPMGSPGYGVRREALDALLVEQARVAGAAVHSGVKVSGMSARRGRVAALRTDAGDVEAAVFVAADGLQSRLRRLAGLDAPRIGSRFGVTGHVALLRPIEPVVQVFFERGYELYVTPVGPTEANVALLTRRTGMRRFAGNPARGLGEVIAACPALPGAVLRGDALAAGPFPRGARRPWRANLLLVGDAAGFYDGITGEGMTAALLSAPLAAEAIVRYLGSGNATAFRQYASRRRVLVRNSELLARVSLTIGGDRRLAAFAIRNLSRHPETFAKLVAVNGGDRPLRDLRPRDLLAMLAGV